MNGSEEPDAPLRRRIIIDLLAPERPRAHNVHVLSAALAGLGEDVPAGQVDELLDWLAGEGLVEIACEREPRTARATEKGASAAAGQLAVEGVAPRPE